MAAVSANEIEQAAVEHLGVVDASISRYRVRLPVSRIPIDNYEHELGVWHTLAVKRTADSEWEVVGRRRTRDELLRMIEKLSQVVV